MLLDLGSGSGGGGCGGCSGSPGGGGCGPGSCGLCCRDWYPGWRRSYLDVEVVEAGQEGERRPGGEPGGQRVGGGGAARGRLVETAEIYFQIFWNIRAGVSSEIVTFCRDITVLLVITSVLEDPQAPGRHTVDAPVRDAVLVADADREPPVVGSHHLDDGALGTLEVKSVSLAGVGRLHGSAASP